MPTPTPSVPVKFSTKNMLILTGAATVFGAATAAFTGGMSLIPLGLGCLVGGGVGLVGGGIGQGLNVLSKKTTPARAMAAVTLAATMVLTGWFNDVRNNALANTKRSAPQPRLTIPKDPFIKDEPAPAPKVETVAPKPAAETVTPPAVEAVAPPQVVETTQVATPSITNGQKTLEVRYMPVEAVIENNTITGMTFAMFEMGPNGEVTRQRLGTYYGGKNVVWDKSNYSIGIARALMDVKQCTLLDQDASQQRVLLDNGKVAVVSKKTGGVQSLTDPSPADLQLAEKSRVKNVPFLSANKFIRSYNAKMPILVKDDVLRFAQPSAQSSSVVIDESTSIRIGKNGNVETLTIDPVTKNTTTAPATADQVDTARFFQSYWKQISMGPVFQQGPSTTALALGRYASPGRVL